ncbi:hypothetical protein BVX93_01790, partial [bacterium B13(2017)]
YNDLKVIQNVLAVVFDALGEILPENPEILTNILIEKLNPDSPTYNASLPKIQKEIIVGAYLQQAAVLQDGTEILVIDRNGQLSLDPQIFNVIDIGSGDVPVEKVLIIKQVLKVIQALFKEDNLIYGYIENAITKLDNNDFSGVKDLFEFSSELIKMAVSEGVKGDIIIAEKFVMAISSLGAIKKLLQTDLEIESFDIKKLIDFILSPATSQDDFPDLKNIINEDGSINQEIIDEHGEVVLTKEDVVKYLIEKLGSDETPKEYQAAFFELIDTFLQASLSDFGISLEEGISVETILGKIGQDLLKVVFEAFSELNLENPEFVEEMLIAYMDSDINFDFDLLTDDQKEIIINALFLEMGEISDLDAEFNLFEIDPETGEVELNMDLFKEFDASFGDDLDKKEAFVKKIIEIMSTLFGDDIGVMESLALIEGALLEGDLTTLSDLMELFNDKIKMLKKDAKEGKLEPLAKVIKAAIMIAAIVEKVLEANDLDLGLIVAQIYDNLTSIIENASIESIRDTAKIMLGTLTSLVKKMGKLAKAVLQGNKEAIKNLKTALNLLNLMTEISNKYSTDAYLNLSRKTFEKASQNVNALFVMLNEEQLEDGDSYLFDFSTLKEALKDPEAVQAAFEKAVTQLGTLMAEMAAELDKKNTNWSKVATLTDYAKTVFEASTLIGDTIIMLANQDLMSVFKMTKAELDTFIKNNGLENSPLASAIKNMKLDRIAKVLGEELKAVIDILNNKGRGKAIENDFYYKRLKAHVNVGHAYLAQMKIATTVMNLLKSGALKGKILNLGKALKQQAAKGKIPPDVLNLLKENGFGTGDGKTISIKVFNHMLEKMNQKEEELYNLRKQMKAVLGPLEAQYDFI